MRACLPMASCGVLLFAAALLLALPTSAAMTTCRISYTLEGWSFVYEGYTGSGTVQCENGESAEVVIRTHGGGLTFGQSEIEGRGLFSEVRGIHEVYGRYANAGAHAGFISSAAGRVMTRGPVSLSMAGTGRGFDLGFAFGSFRIKRPLQSP